VDDPSNTTEWGIQPAPPDDPWGMKLAITDLENVLREKGAMIGAMLIVGGPEIVPFHQLPNPTDDIDSVVYSDNPYATRDDNYFIPEWPVGRLPGGTAKDPQQLIRTLQNITANHQQPDDLHEKIWTKIWQWFQNLLKNAKTNPSLSFGYSAEAWKKASISVYQQIGNPIELLTSPPMGIEESSQTSLPAIQGDLAYFNLHGLIDSAHWYGQRETISGTDSADYPTALSPTDLTAGDQFPKIVFSEACYGANILKKATDNSLALSFLSQGCQAFVGSTVISYGSISTPLNAADLLGKAFWLSLKEGYPAGEALRRAKIFLAKEMHKRQGYLDGEDQKTLISFVLFGDPLAQYPHLNGEKHQKSIQRWMKTPAVKTICDRQPEILENNQVPPEVLQHVKQIVHQYLPGMEGAQVTISYEHNSIECSGHECPTSQLGTKTRPYTKPNRRVVTLSKAIPIASHTQTSYARLTLNPEGKVVKLAVSR
jgi:hypothetical protein